ncbi:MAG: hypothetical protein LBM27_03035 [Lactobacillaceae bacterium]|jgi:hypothetical protein|nr:hypothetical protein [Lactobacillaceae bacterium]
MGINTELNNETSKTYYLQLSTSETVVAANASGVQIPINGQTRIAITSRKDHNYDLYIDYGPTDVIRLNGKTFTGDLRIVSPNQNIEINNTEIIFGFDILRITYFETLPDNFNSAFLSDIPPQGITSSITQFTDTKLKPFSKSAEKQSLVQTILPTLISLPLIFGVTYFIGTNLSFLSIMIVTLISGLIVGILSAFLNNRRNYKNRQKRLARYQEYLNKVTMANVKNVDSTEVIEFSEKSIPLFDIPDDDFEIEIEQVTDYQNQILVNQLVSLEHNRTLIVDRSLGGIQKIIFEDLIKNPSHKYLVITKDLNLWAEFKLKNNLIDITDDLSYNLENYQIIVTDFDIDLHFSGSHLVILENSSLATSQFNKTIILNKPVAAKPQIKALLLNSLFQGVQMDNNFKNNFQDFFGFPYQTESITNRWEAKSEGLKVPVGFDQSQNKLFLDLEQSAQGPHMLVSGTTGSGKTEFLLTYLYSLAFNYSPAKVGFLVIDFKGGGLSNRLSSLPHLLGSFTNLENDQIQRSFHFIEKEIQKRQTIFKNLGISDISEFENLNDDAFVPHLFIVADEFAELKTTNPEYIPRLISIARIGRSLGIHLILATQKASGNINDEMVSNISTRVIFKTNSIEESQFMVGDDSALALNNPGEMVMLLDGQKLRGRSFNFNGQFIDSEFDSVSFDDKKTSIIETVNPSISQKEKEFDDVVPVILPNSVENVLGIADENKQPLITFDWLSFDKALIIGGKKMGKTNTIDALIKNSPEDSEFIFLGKSGTISTKIIFMSEIVTTEILDKIDYYISSNPKTILVTDNLDQYLQTEYGETLKQLVSKFRNISSTTLLQSIPVSLQSQFSRSFYLGTSARDIFSNYSIPDIPGRAVFQDFNKQQVIQIGFASAEESLFSIPENKLNILPEKLESKELSLEDNDHHFPVGLEYFTAQEIKLEIAPSNINIFLFENFKSVAPQLFNLIKIFPGANFIDPTEENWQLSSTLTNYRSNLNSIDLNQPLIIANLESFINKFSFEKYSELLKTLPVFVFSDIRYFKHSFDGDLKYFKHNSTNILESTSENKFATLNDQQKILMPVI